MTPALFAAGMVGLGAALCVGAVSAWRAVEARPLRPLEAFVARLAVAAVMAMPLLADAGALQGPRGGGGGLPTTGGTMTGQIVSSGVSVDWTSGTNEDLVFTPNGTGQCTCGTSFTGLAVSADAQASAGETWASFTTSDAPSGIGSISFSNVDTTNARVSANMYMFSGGTAANKNWIQAGVTAANDSGAEPVLVIAAQTTIGGSIGTRPLISMRNAGTEVFGVYPGGASATGYLGASGKIYTQAVSPAALSGTTNDYAGCTSSFCRIDTGASSRDLTGISPLTGGTHHYLCNINATNNIVLKHESGSSSAANRFTFNGSTDRTIAPAECFSVIYDSTTARWRELK